MTSERELERMRHKALRSERKLLGAGFVRVRFAPGVDRWFENLGLKSRIVGTAVEQLADGSWRKVRELWAKPEDAAIARTMATLALETAMEVRHHIINETPKWILGQWKPEG